MKKNNILRAATLSASLMAAPFPAFAQSGPALFELANADHVQLPGSGAMEGADRTGTTNPSGSGTFSVESGAVDTEGRVAKPAGDYAVTEIDRDLAARIRTNLTGDPQLAPATGKNLHITVNNGAVTLHGRVMNEQTKEQISARIEAIAGVQSLNNRLAVGQD